MSLRNNFRFNNSKHHKDEQIFHLLVFLAIHLPPLLTTTRSVPYNKIVEKREAHGYAARIHIMRTPARFPEQTCMTKDPLPLKRQPVLFCGRKMK